MDTIPASNPMENPPLAPLGGLDPANLLKQGAAEDTFIDGAGNSFNPPPIPELAAIFPQFEILELIGKGGMGAVYKVRQKDLDRIVALKILPPAIGQSQEFSNRFTREAKALAKLNHPGIVTLHEFGQADGLYFILMEFVDGVNLAQLMQTGRISPREALAIVPQICDALQFAHDQGIVHRDIKPENILLDRLGRVKVADFGIAKVVAAVCEDPIGSGDIPVPTDQTLAGKIIGTPQYMAPEQIDHPADVDHRADIYALGVVFYQMLTGELPGKRLEAPSKKVHIDVRLDEIVLRAMEKDPELRFQQASVMRTRVDDLVDVASDPSPTVSDKSSPSLFSAGEYHRGFFGRFIWLYQKRGFLELFSDRLVFSKDDFRQTIPLSALRSVQIGWHSLIAKPTGSKFLALSYEANGSTESVHLLPYWSGSNSNPLVTEWCNSICRATRLATGRDFTKELVESEFKPLRSRWVILLALVPALMICAIPIGLRECGRVPATSVREPESNLPVLEKTDIGGPDASVSEEVANEYLDHILGMATAKSSGLGSSHPSQIVAQRALDRFRARHPSVPDATCLKLASARQLVLAEKKAVLEDNGLGKVHPAIIEVQLQLDALAGVELGFSGRESERELPMAEKNEIGSPEVGVLAEMWLAGIDAGKYSQSWKAAANFFQSANTESRWVSEVGQMRKPLGAVKSREIRHMKKVNTLTGAPDGEYFIIQFNTSFAAKENAVEVVRFKLEEEGNWKAAGYLIR